MRSSMKTAESHKIAIQFFCSMWISIGFATSARVSAQDISLSAARDSAPDASSTDGRVEPRAIVLHAGNAVRFSIPHDWHVHEIGRGREVRLLISPSPIDGKASDVTDGLWLTLEYYPNGLNPETDERLRALALASLESALKGQYRTTAIRIISHRGHVAANIDFLVETQPKAKSVHLTSRSPQREQETTVESRGFHMLVQTAWCRCRLHAMAPAEVYDARLPEFESILDQLRFEQPEVNSQEVLAQVSDAASILGSWKAYAARLRLHGDATVEVVTDTPFRFQTADGTAEHVGNEVAGVFQARGDLLLIQWRDGSKLNYRWRLAGDRLLMTDHEGRMTSLVRIAE